MRASAALPLLLLSVLAACSPKTVVGITACEGGDADACEIVAARYFLGEGVPRDEAAGAMFTYRAAQFRNAACLRGDQSACDKIMARGGPVPMPPLPLDSPKSGVEVTFTVELPDANRTLVNGKPIADDAALREAAKKLVGEQPGTRAVIRADQSVPHGRVIAVIDTLKQAGITKIAFGVAPVASAAPR